MIIATAGHVDHGKTTLIKALTGTNTDRLPEEKKRGLTIDLGFAYLVTESGQRLAFIDVPGHEKFVRNMIAGVGMVDIAILVVAADDGPMPQTLEHIAILQLMSVRQLVPVISKVDLVTAERAAQVAESVGELIQRAGFEHVKAIAMSASDPVAVSSLRHCIEQLAVSQSARNQRGYFRMAIDRSFVLEGSGTVVTGTVVGGSIDKNDSVSLVTDGTEHGKSARVRNIHAQNTEAPSAQTGQRCALNVSGDLTRSMLRRGDWLVSNATIKGVRFIDVVLTPALFADQTTDTKQENNTLKHWTAAHLHIGTASITCRIALLDVDSLKQNQSGLARLICEKEVAAVHGDCFVLRDQSARKTIAGGRVLDPNPPKRGRSRPNRLLELRALDASIPSEVVANLLELNTCGVRLQPLVRKLNLASTELEEIAEQLGAVIFKADSQQWAIRSKQSDSLREALVLALQKFHSDKPDALGADSAELKRRCENKLELGVLEYHLKLLIEKSKVIRNATVYRLANHDCVLSKSDEVLWTKAESTLLEAALTPSRITEMAEVLELSVEEATLFLNRCVSHGRLYKVTDNRYFLPQTLRELAQIAVDLSNADALSVAGYRDKSGVGRNLVVEILEYFDRCRFTQRVGNDRLTLCAVEDKF